MELNTHYVCTPALQFSQHRHDSLQRQKKSCFYKEAATKQIKMIINNTIDIWKINIYDHESYGSCFQPGLILISWKYLVCSRQTLGRITPHKAKLSGVGCVGSIKATFGQSQSQTTSIQAGLVIEWRDWQCLPTQMPITPLECSWGNEKILHFGLFYHKMKHFCLQIMAQQ